MKKLFLTTSAAALLGATAASADPTFMLGGTFTFGGGQDSQFGISARVLSNNTVDEHTLGAGVTYYPGSGDIGYDVFAGWIFENTVFGVGYDFGMRAPLVTLGVADTEEERRNAPPPMVVPMPPAPMPPAPMPVSPPPA